MPQYGYSAWITHQDNLTANAVVTASSEASGFPVSNVYDEVLTSVWRSGALPGAETIDMDNIAPVEVGVVALCNHNLTAGATILIKAGTTSAVSNFSAAIPWRENLAFLKLSAVQTYRYWQVHITDDSNPDGYVKVGYVFLGELTLPDTYNFRYGGMRMTDHVNLEIPSPYGVQFVEEMYLQESFRLDFGPLRDDEMLTIRNLYLDSKRDRHPLLFIPDRDGTDAYFVRITSVFEERLESKYRYITMELQEDSCGRSF